MPKHHPPSNSTIYVAVLSRATASKLYSMDAEGTKQIIALQESISKRLAELGYANGHSAENISHHLAEIAVLGRAFSETTLPLFLSLDSEHAGPLAQLMTSLKCDLEEISDALVDVDSELRDLMGFLNNRWDKNA